MSPPHPQLSSLLVSPAVSASTILRAPAFPSPVHRNGRGLALNNKSMDKRWYIPKLTTLVALQYSRLVGVTLPHFASLRVSLQLATWLHPGDISMTNLVQCLQLSTKPCVPLLQSSKSFFVLFTLSGPGLVPHYQLTAVRSSVRDIYG